MKVSLGSNIGALQAVRRLDRTTSELRSVYERLSTGQRINTAADDAAGLSIAESLRTDSRVFQQALRNVGDGISLLNIADSALENLSGILVRLTELSEQAASGTFGGAQRATIDAEAQALRTEYYRIAQSTEFNGMQILNGELGKVLIQTGYSSIEGSIGGTTATGSFQEPASFSAGIEPFGINVGDFNGDSIVDLVVTDRIFSSVNFLLGNGDGTFGPANSLWVGNSPEAIEIGDFNGDGVADLATTNSIVDRLAVLLGNGDGTFGPVDSFSAGNRPSGLGIADFNRDGVQDLVTANSYLAITASVFLGNGDGTFAPRTTYDAGLAPRLLDIADMNSDGFLDLVTASSGSNSMNVLLGNGDGTFQSQLSFAASSASSAMGIGDFNGDGIPDLVTAHQNTDSVDIHLGNGDGTFTSGNSFAVETDPSSLTLRDFNSDGVLDLAATNSVSNSVSVLIGNGDGTFARSNSFAVGSRPTSITAADFNGDGALDLVATDRLDGTVSVLLGETTEGGVPPLPLFSLKTQEGARQALPEFKRTLSELAEQRGILGALQSRFETAANTLRASSENFRAAEGRIREADVAVESSNLVRLKILREAASAVLAQANQQPALAVQLLS